MISRRAGAWICGLAIGGAALVSVNESASASVSSIAVNPTFQTQYVGTVVFWGWAWGGSGTYTPVFTYGDGAKRTYGAQTNGGSGSASHQFSNCTSNTYTQRITVNTSVATAQTRSDASHGC